MVNADELLVEIAHCPNVRRYVSDPDHSHPCSEIVVSQRTTALKDHQIPEPWSGDIMNARLLFLSSNPSISDTELYPRWSWNRKKIRSYFNERFGKWIRDGVYTLQHDGSYGTSVAFWREVRSRAAELYEREDVVPGVDYALTEVVHCKSRNNRGVASAADECAERYLIRVLSFSRATVIVALGGFAARVMTKHFAMDSTSPVHGPVNIAGRKRFIVFLAQPGSNQPRKFATVVPTQLARLRIALRGAK